MPWTDDELGHLIRAADPARTPRDAEPSAADWERMRRTMSEPATAVQARGTERLRAGALGILRALRPATHSSRPARIALRAAWAMPVVAAAVSAALALGPLTAAPAYAVTPPVLAAEPIGLTLGQVLDGSIDRLLSATPRTPTRDAEVVRWALRDDGGDDPVITPEWQRWVWNEDGTGQLESTAGAPYSVTADGRIVAPAAEAPAEGTAIESPQPDWYGYFPEPPPADADALRTYLEQRTALKPDADGLAVWGSLSLLRDEWILSPAQQAAALQLLRDAGDLTLLGSVTDRFGRDGIALKVSSTDRPGFGATVVLASASREIIAADILYLGGVSRLDVPAGSVIEYSAWLSR